MNVIVQQSKDRKLMERLNLEPLRPEIVACGEGADAAVKAHNDRLSQLHAMLDKLDEERIRLEDFAAWADVCAADVMQLCKNSARRRGRGSRVSDASWRTASVCWAPSQKPWTRRWVTSMPAERN